MPRISSQKIRQMLLSTGTRISDVSTIPEKLQLYNDLGEPLSLGGSYTRHILDDQSAPVAPQLVQYSELELYPSVRVFKLATNRPARVRIYPNATYRDRDVTRSIGVKPRGDHGRLLEVVTIPGMLSLVLSPAVDMSSEIDTDPKFYVSLSNLDTVSGAIKVTYTYIRTE